MLPCATLKEQYTCLALLDSSSFTHTWNCDITTCTYHKQKSLNISLPPKQSNFKKYKKKERLKMKETSMRLLPNMASLKLDIAKNSNVLYVEESNLIRLAFLQGTQICAQKRHASLEKQTARHSSIMRLLACHLKQAC